MVNADIILESLVQWAKVDKRYAWWAALNYEKMCPAECGGMQERLKQRMLELKEKL